MPSSMYGSREDNSPDEQQILQIVGEELQQSAGGNENDFIDSNRQNAYAAYLGQPDGKEKEGRSSVVSTDVADAIEWIMPEIVKAFTQNNEVVAFDACDQEDADQAELESEFVYDILMKDNNGFLVLHQFIKDALMQKNGFIKVFYEDESEESIESYTGLTEPELMLLLSQEGVELTEQTSTEMDGMVFYDVKVVKRVEKKQIKVISVPPEEFRINKQHNSVDVSTARFSAHVMLTTAGDLVAMGYDKEFVDTIPSSQVYEDDREYRFYMMDETVYPDRDVTSDPSLRVIEIAECYMHMDIDGDGIAEFVKVTVSGGDNPDVVLDIEEIDDNPFISSTAILMSHKLFGLSIYDRLKQIQDQKTTLWRNILDNMYLQNNQRTAVLDGQVNLDDLMLSRPGGIVRMKSLGAATPLVTPPLPGDAYKMMDYLDQVRAGRSGVSPEGAITDNMIGDRVGSQGVERMMSQKEELVGLMIRVIAETGIKPLCIKIRDLAKQHLDVIKDYRFRGKWVEVNPTTWRDRSHTTVRVGTGSGNRQEQLGAITQILVMQEKALALPGQSSVRPNEIYAAMNDFAKFSGMPGIGKYMLDPESPEGQQFKEQVDKQQAEEKQMSMQMEHQQLEAQTKVANAQQKVVEIEGMNIQLKNQIDTQKNQLTLMKQQQDAETAFYKQQLEQAKALITADGKDAEIEFKYYDADQRAEIEYARIKMTEKAAEDNNDNESDE